MLTKEAAASITSPAQGLRMENGLKEYILAQMAGDGAIQAIKLRTTTQVQSSPLLPYHGTTLKPLGDQMRCFADQDHFKRSAAMLLYGSYYIWGSCRMARTHPSPALLKTRLARCAVPHIHFRITSLFICSSSLPGECTATPTVYKDILLSLLCVSAGRTYPVNAAGAFTQPIHH